MSVNPNTTNLAVNKEIANRVRGIAKELNLTALEVTNQLLQFAMDQNEVRIEVKSLTFRPKDVQPVPIKPRQRMTRRK